MSDPSARRQQTDREQRQNQRHFEQALTPSSDDLQNHLRPLPDLQTSLAGR